MAITIPAKGQTDWDLTLNAALVELESEIDTNASKVNGVTVSGTPSNGQILTATGAATATWSAPSGSGALLATNNLSDLTNVPAARTNLGLGTAATASSSAFDAAGAATTAQANAIADAANKYTPLRADVFNVATYGAIGDGKLSVTGSITSGTNTLTTTDGQFVSGDQGKAILVVGAAATGVTTLVTTISGFTNSNSVTLGTNAANTISNAIVMWATDDTATIQSAINAAQTYASAHGTATVFFPGGSGLFYGIAGALNTAHSGNSQLYLAPVSTTGNKQNIIFAGVGNGSVLQHWLQKGPQLNGSTLVSFGVFASSVAQSISVTNNGNPCVIGGPSQPGGYGVAPGIFSNMAVTIQNLSILTSHSVNGLTYSAGDMSGVSNCALIDFAYGATASPATVPSIDQGGSYANGLSIGFLMPANGNNDQCVVRNFTCHGGYTFGYLMTEHTVIDNARILYCWSALCPVGNYFSSVGATHAMKVSQISIEACSVLVNIFGVGSAGIGPIVDIDQLDTETSSPTFLDRNSGAALQDALGTIKLTGLFTAANLTLGGPTGLNIINGQKAQSITTVATNYTMSLFDNIILADATSGNISITIVDARNTAKNWVVKKTDASANTVTILPQSGQTIDGQSSVVLSAQNQAYSAIPSGGNWYVV